MIKTKTSSTLFAALLVIVIFSISTMAAEQTNDYERIQAYDIESDQVVAISADFEYCPDGTMVRDLRDCPDFVDGVIDSKESNSSARTGRNPQTGKEIKIAASIGGGATITTSAGKVYYADVKISQTILDKASPALAKTVCVISRNGEIICEVTSFDGEGESKLYCWGKNELSECPSEEIRIETGRGSGGGKVSVKDLKIESKSSGDDGEIEVFSWSWGTSISSRATDSTDPDSDNVEFRYVWLVSGQNPTSRTSESNGTSSLSFTKIKIEYSVDGGSGGSILIEIPEVRVPINTLMFTTIAFDAFAISENNERCNLSRVIGGGDCDDGNPFLTPGREADAKKVLDGFTRRISAIKSSLERCEDDVCRQVSLNADKRHELVEKAKINIKNSPPVVREVQSIVREDIVALERCRTDVCRNVLAQERELLVLINDYLDLDSDGDGILDYWVDADNDGFADRRDLDDDGDGVLTRIESNARMRQHLDKATPVLFSVRNNEDFDEEDKEVIREYLSNLSEIRGRDFGLSVALASSENPRVREVRYREDTNTVEVEHDEEVRFLGFIRMNARSKTTIDEQGNEETKYPWWAALATKSEKPRFKAGADLSKSVN